VREFPTGLVVRALKRLDVVFPGVTEWRDVAGSAIRPTAAFALHSHAGPGPRAGRIVLGDLTAREKVLLTEQIYEEGGWTVRFLAGRCSCGTGFRTPPELTRPEQS